MLEQAAGVVVEMGHALSAMNIDRMTALNDKLRSIENEAERLMLELDRDLYSGKLDGQQMFLLKKFFEILEKAIDRCRPDGGEKDIDTWIAVACAVVMAMGTAIGEWRIIKTLGHKLVKLHAIDGFAAETA